MRRSVYVMAVVALAGVAWLIGGRLVGSGTKTTGRAGRPVEVAGARSPGGSASDATTRATSAPVDASVAGIRAEVQNGAEEALPNEEALLPFAAADRAAIHQLFAPHYGGKNAELLTAELQPKLEDAVYHLLNWEVAADEQSFRACMDAKFIFGFGRRLPADYKVDPNLLRKPSPVQGGASRAGFTDIPFTVEKAKPAVMYPPEALKLVPPFAQERLNTESLMVKVHTVQKLTQPMGDGTRFIKVEHVLFLSPEQPGLPRVFAEAQTTTGRIVTAPLGVPQYLRNSGGATR